MLALLFGSRLARNDRPLDASMTRVVAIGGVNYHCRSLRYPPTKNGYLVPNKQRISGFVCEKTDWKSGFFMVRYFSVALLGKDQQKGAKSVLQL